LIPRSKISALIRAKKKRHRWALLTAYDAPTAEILEKAGVDFILVGDSVGMVVLGYPSTTCVSMDEMIHHAKAVRRGAKRSLVIGDMPLQGIQRGPRQALESAKRFIHEAGCDAIKLEWGPKALQMTKLLIRHKIPVMGHVGLTPQTARKKNGFKVQGQDAKSAIEILKAAKAFEGQGVFSVLLECVPREVARWITRKLRIPVIGIGAGPDCDGQVLVFHDLVGIFKKFRPRFVKHYAELDSVMTRAVTNYVREVKTRKFPAKKHSFSMSAKELAEFRNEAKRF